MIPLTVAFTNRMFGSASSSFRLAREIEHKDEYVAFLSVFWRQRVFDLLRQSVNPPHDFSPPMSNNIRL